MTGAGCDLEQALTRRDGRQKCEDGVLRSVFTGNVKSCSVALVSVTLWRSKSPAPAMSAGRGGRAHGSIEEFGNE
jgi:hypothetical protein